MAAAARARRDEAAAARARGESRSLGGGYVNNLNIKCTDGHADESDNFEEVYMEAAADRARSAEKAGSATGGDPTEPESCVAEAAGRSQSSSSVGKFWQRLSLIHI